MKKIVIYLIFINLTFFLFSLPPKADVEEVGLKVKAWVQPIRLSRQQQGHVVLRFNLPANLRVKPIPFFVIEFELSDGAAFSKNFFTNSDLGIEILEENGQEYLDLSQPVKIPFTVPLETNRGRHVIKGRVKYFACSLKENWCLKTTAKFETYFYTRSTVYQKKTR